MPKASITAPDDLHHGDSFTPTFDPGNFQQRGNTYLYATLDCYQEGVHVLGGQQLDLQGFHPANAAPFLLDNPNIRPDGTPYWASGPASCRLRMFSLDFGNGHVRDYASDDFEVAG